MNTEGIINKAKDLLKKSPLDAGHDLSHHERVSELAQEILSYLPEKIQKEVDIDVLKIAAMWHDVQIPDNTNVEYLQEILPNNERTKQITKAISEHEFWDRPKTFEGKILYDADKLDTLNIERGRQIVKAIKRREISESRKSLYIKIGKFWLKHMRSRLHFDYSKKLYDDRLKEIAINSELIKLAKEINIDMKIIDEAISAKPNIIEKLIIKLFSLYHMRK